MGFDVVSDLTDGLIGCWRFDEGGGQVARDASGNGNDGQLLNVQFATGEYQGSVEIIGGYDSHVSVPASPTLNGFDSQISVTVRLFPRALRLGYTVGASRQIGTLLHPDQFYLGFGPDPVTHAAVRYKWHMGTAQGDGTFTDGDCYFGDAGTDRWIDLAGTYDGQTMRLYVDGQEIGSRPLTGKLRVDDNPVTIGGEENGPVAGDVENEFDGYIDEVRIYDRALSAEDIATLHQLSQTPAV